MDLNKIEALKKQNITADESLHDVGWNGAINEVLKMLKAGQHETVVIGDSWISTKEKLPPNDTQVLVYGFRKYEGEKDILGYEKTFVCEAKHFDDGCFVKGVNVEIYATHWLPLPEPPKSQ